MRFWPRPHPTRPTRHTWGIPAKAYPCIRHRMVRQDFRRSLAKCLPPGPSTRTNQSRINSILEDCNKSAKQNRPRFVPAGAGCAPQATGRPHFISRARVPGPINVTKIPSLMVLQDGFHTRPVQVRQCSRKFRDRSGDLQDTDANGCRPCSREHTSVRTSLTAI